MSETFTYIEVIDFKNKIIISRFDVTGMSDSYVDKQVRQTEMSLDVSQYCVEANTYLEPQTTGEINIKQSK